MYSNFNQLILQMGYSLKLIQLFENLYKCFRLDDLSSKIVTNIYEQCINLQRLQRLSQILQRVSNIAKIFTKIARSFKDCKEFQRLQRVSKMQRFSKNAQTFTNIANICKDKSTFWAEGVTNTTLWGVTLTTGHTTGHWWQ